MIINSVQDFRSPPSRIVSLVPSQTELLWYLGLENETVGIIKVLGGERWSCEDEQGEEQCEVMLHGVLYV